MVINNNIGQVDMAVRDDDMALHWYTPMLPVASRRVTWYRRWPLWLAGGVFVAGTTASCYLAWKQPWREVEARYLFMDAWQVVSFTSGGWLRWLNPLGWATQITHTVSKLAKACSLWMHPVPWWRKCWWHATWAVTATSFGIAMWALNPHVPDPLEPDGPGQPALMVEVTQQEALAQPTHFICPAGLRALVTEKVLLLERTPQMVQRIKSVAGKWCDDHQVGAFERPRYIAGAVAACMTVPHLEMDLLLFNSWDPIQRAHRRLQNYHNQNLLPDATSRFWQWMRQGRR